MASILVYGMFKSGRAKIEEVVSSLGRQLVSVSSENQARQLIAKGKVDLIILAAEQKQRDCFKVAAAIRTMEGGQEVPILFYPASYKELVERIRDCDREKYECLPSDFEEEELIFKITSLKRSDESCSNVNDELEEIFDSTDDGILGADALNKKLLTGDKTITHMRGHSGNEIRRLGDEDIHSDQELGNGFEKFEKQLQRGITIAGDLPVKRKNGGVFYADSTSSPLRTAGSDDQVGIFRDIRERKKMEGALRVREATINSIVKAAPVGICFVDNQCIRWVSNEFKNMVGYSDEELLGKSTRSLYESENEFERVERVKGGQIANQGVGEVETRWKRRDGVFIDVFLRSAPVDADKPSAGTTLTALDITGRKEAEERLRQSQKMEAIGRLAGGIAHDFNNILSPIIGYSELCLRSVPEEMRLNDNLQQVLSAALRARDLVRQILTFSRKSAQELRLLNVQSIVKETLKFLRSSLPANIEILRDIDMSCAPVMADPTQLYQLMINICTNAAHALKGKGGVIEVRLKEQNFHETQLVDGAEIRPGNYLLLSVHDTGCGIDPKIRERIFEPYFTTKSVEEGTGLGLAIVHGIVKNHGGYLVIASRLGEGTSFNVYLPLASRRPLPFQKSTEGALPIGTEHILLIDDEEPLVMMLRDTLESLGYKVTTCTSSRGALEMYRSRPWIYDLVLTDYTMPGLLGTELAKEFLKIRKDLPIILCSGHHNPCLTEEKAKAIGVGEFLQKPIIIRDLAFAVRRLLDRKASPSRFAMAN